MNDAAHTAAQLTQKKRIDQVERNAGSIQHISVLFHDKLG